MILPVVFPDGSTAELRAPPELDLASQGVWARTSGVLGKDAATGRELLIVYGNPPGLTAGKAPVALPSGRPRFDAKARRVWVNARIGARNCRAERRSCRLRPTIGAKVICSIGVQVHIPQ
jgi:hypothetical protein